jgi:adenine-specific DNA-methyltransferase
MPKPSKPKSIEAIRHDDKRKNIPTAEYRPVLSPEEQNPVQVAYERRNRDLDPQLVWRGKDEQDWSDLVVSAPPLYIQEKVHPKALIDDLMKSTEWLAAHGAAQVADRQPQATQMDLFADFNGIPAGVEKTEFYRHDQNWSNRMILGDALQVMASLAEREGLRGKVQCIYIDPPYGIKFNSNFQWSTASRDVKDGNAAHITREPEQVKAFRDTWRDGIHSYLTYLRDRLTVARDLLSDSGSIFVQIGDENVHRVRALMDEVFGEGNFVSLISFATTTGLTSQFISAVNDYLIWFAKSRDSLKYRKQVEVRRLGDDRSSRYQRVELLDGTTREVSSDSFDLTLYRGTFALSDLTSSHEYSLGRNTIHFQGASYVPGKRYWSTSPDGMRRLGYRGRLSPERTRLGYKRFFEDYPAIPISNNWPDIGGVQSRLDQKVYVVQTSTSAVQRCLLMTTDPGDLVLDPTCVREGTRVWVAPSPALPASGEGAAPDLPPLAAAPRPGGSGLPPLAGGLRGGAGGVEGALIPIEQVRPGDSVYAHDGKPHRIVRVITKQYRGEIIELRRAGSEQALWLTADHRVLAKLRPAPSAATTTGRAARPNTWSGAKTCAAI